MPATLDHVRPMASRPRDDGEFFDYGWRPIFKEHTKNGVTFDSQAMERIAENCNERIRNSKDFCPIVICHTEDGKDNDQELVGFFGPYKVAPFGADGKQAIWARERWYKEDADKRRKFPRLSVEYWGSKSDPTNGYLDPACVLGSETPELDLGIHYSKGESDRLHFKYMAEAGGSNTFPPSGTERREQPERYQGGSLTQADIQQIVAALKPTIDEAVQAAAARLQPVGADPNGLLTDGAAGPGDDADEFSPFTDDGLGESGEDAEDEFAGDDADFDTDDDSDEVPEEHAGAPGDEDEDDEDDAPGNDDDTDVLDDRKKTLYAKSLGDSQEPNMADNLEQQVTRYRKEAEDYRKRSEDLTKERDEYRAKYQKELDARREVESNHAALSERVAKIEADRLQAVRYQKLNELANKGYTFDVAEELKDCEGLNDAQFDRHCDRIQSRYQRVPQSLAGKLAAGGVRIAEPARTDADDHRDALKRDRYSKLAAENVQLARSKGEKADFGREYERLMREDPEHIGAATVAK